MLRIDNYLNEVRKYEVLEKNPPPCHSRRR
jgi:hypothetical protein